MLCRVECIVNVNNTLGRAVKLVKMYDGVDSCTVAFVPCVKGTPQKVQSHLNKFVQVVELYMDSNSMYKSSKSKGNKGMS